MCYQIVLQTGAIGSHFDERKERGSPAKHGRRTERSPPLLQFLAASPPPLLFLAASLLNAAGAQGSGARVVYLGTGGETPPFEREGERERDGR